MADVSVELIGDLDHVRRYKEAVQRALSSGAGDSFEKLSIKVIAMYSSFVQRRFNIFSRGGGDWPPLAPSTVYRRARATVERAKREADANLRRGYSERVEKEKGGAKYLVRRVFGEAQHQKAMKRAETRVKRFFRQVYGWAPARGQGANQRATHSPASGSVSILRDTGTLFNALAINGNPANISRKRGPIFEFGIGGPMAHPGGHATVGRIAAYHQNGGTMPNRPPQRKILVSPPAADEVWAEWGRAVGAFTRELWNSTKG